MSSELPSVAADDVAWVDAQTMREVDRVMAEDLHVELVQMMENAGGHLARLVLHGGWATVDEPRRATVYAGRGGNGGGGLVAARHLHVAGVDVVVVLDREPEALTPVTRHQLDVVERLGLAVDSSGDGRFEGDVAVDALVGYGLSGDPDGRTAALVEQVNEAPVVVALDAPSGLDVTTGRVGEPCVFATATLTLALPKAGLRTAPPVGRLLIADITVPPSVYEALGVGPVPDFRAGPVLEVVERDGP